MSAFSSLPLVKAHAFGNDFLLLDGTDSPAGDLAPLARRVCDRHRGIGADGLMRLTSTGPGADTELWNADGSRAEVSGNGVRCAAAWVARQRGLQAGGQLVIGTVAGPKRMHLLEVDGLRYTFRAEMGPPTDVRHETIDVAGTPVPCIVLRVGNPQCIVLGPASESRLGAIAAPLAVHPFFPEGTNVELVEVIDPHHVRILIWERGVGPTEASGTGACASAVAAAFAGLTSRDVRVESPGGVQHVEWTPETIWLTGWADLVGDARFWT